MKTVVLASGSKGNSTLVFNDDTKILIDFGMSYNYIYNSLKELNINIDDINAILITHTHIDHIKGLNLLIKNNDSIIYATVELEKELKKLYPNGNYIIYDETTTIGSLNIEHFKTSHDSGESLGFIVSENNKSLVYLTDTGCIKEKLYDKLKNKNMYIIESNHDIDMLCTGSYPYELKRRILGDKGHLSNKDMCEHFVRLMGKNTNTIVLAHLSKENNTEEKALAEFKNCLNNYNKKIKKIVVAKQDERSEIIEI
ncbi:MAG TPA: MBL fold metallo-hydrolase [Bacilli bacterium]|nr:MBL fold metallo-hydrolase [Bacilli bacterium]